MTGFLFRSIKTEYSDEYLMKRFGGIEFLSRDNPISFNLVNETFINQLNNLINQTNGQMSMADAAKVATLFQVYPPQVSVNNTVAAYRIYL